MDVGGVVVVVVETADVVVVDPASTTTAAARATPTTRAPSLSFTDDADARPLPSTPPHPDGWQAVDYGDARVYVPGDWRIVAGGSVSCTPQDAPTAHVGPRNTGAP